MIPQIGLTGNIGSGKSTVARLLAERGAALIDADDLAREASGDPEVLRRIAAELGSELIVHGRLDRARAARLVFADESARKRLNAIIHPWVARERDRRVRALHASASPPPLIVHDIPLLFEAGLEGTFDAVVVVTAPLEARIARVVERSGLEPAEVRARDESQLPLEHKAARADHLIDNSGDPGDLPAQLERIWPALLGAAQRDPEARS